MTSSGYILADIEVRGKNIIFQVSGKNNYYCIDAFRTFCLLYRV